jgi:hypothetical protein
VALLVGDRPFRIHHSFCFSSQYAGRALLGEVGQALDFSSRGSTELCVAVCLFVCVVVVVVVVVLVVVERFAWQAMQHLETIAATIKLMDADVINLAEVEDCNVLRTLIEKVGDDTYKPYLVRVSETTSDCYLCAHNFTLLRREPTPPQARMWA